MEKKDFAQQMINEYSPKENVVTKIDQLKALDKKVKNFPCIFALVFGIISTLILGTGMCLAMQVIGGTTAWMIAGICIGVVGIGLMLSTYPIFCKLLNDRKKKYADRIIEVSNEILGEE